MNIETYWDLSKKERAALTEEKVRLYVQVELMQRGVIAPELPQYESIEEIEVKKTTYYSVSAKVRYPQEFGNLVFATMADAEAFTKIRPLLVNSDWTSGKTHYYVEAPEGYEVTTKEVVDRAEFERQKSKIAENEAKKKRNDALRAEFERQSKVAGEAAESIWEDYAACGQLEYELKQVVATFNNYVSLSNGDTVVASNFLARAYPTDKIEQAKEWFGIGDMLSPNDPLPAGELVAA